MKRFLTIILSAILLFILCCSGFSTDASAADSVQTDEEFEESIADFPESYKELLREIHEVYPNYTFTADYIDEDFDEIVENELGRKKVSQYSAYSWRALYDESFGSLENYDWDTGTWTYTEGGYTYASKEVIAYYMDPRNFLNTSGIYMFMELSYSEDQNAEDLQSILSGTFLAEDYEPDEDDEDDVRLGGSYAAVIMEAAELSGMSPYVIATSILTEQGSSGSSSLISGYYKASDGTVYDGYYNFFNIGATGSTTNDVIQNGLKMAVTRGWTSRYLSIVGGAQWTSDSYVTQGQDTYYFREFNVTDTDNLWHQYSTAITTARNAASILCEALSSYTNATINFKIPVYNNMTDEAAEEPEYNSHLNNYYFLNIQASGLSPEYTMANHDYTLTVSGNTTLYLSVPDGASYEGKSSYSLKKGKNTVSLVVKSQTGYERTYTVTVTAQAACTLSVQTDLLLGDANGDGKISSLDYVTIKNHIMETRLITDSEKLLAADYNEDGKISSLDYIGIKNYIMGN